MIQNKFGHNNKKRGGGWCRVLTVTICELKLCIINFFVSLDQILIIVFAKCVIKNQKLKTLDLNYVEKSTFI